MVAKLTAERRPVKLTDEELDMYEEHFMPYGITARQFKKFWDLGENIEVAPNTKLVEEGQPQEKVSLVMAGSVFRSSRGSRIPGLDTFPGSRDLADGDAGAWIADINAMQMIDTISSPEHVSRDLYRRRMRKTISRQMEDPPGEVTDEKLLKILQHFAQGFDILTGDDTDYESQPMFFQFQIDQMLHQSRSRWTVAAGEGVVIRTWDLKPLLIMCKGDHEMCSTLRKAFSQSAIKKILAMDTAKLEPLAKSNMPKTAEPEVPSKLKIDFRRRFKNAIMSDSNVTPSRTCLVAKQALS